MVQQDTMRPDPLTLAGFLLSALLGGANVVAVKFSTQGLPPFYGAAVRFFVASILLFGYMALRRVPWPSRAEWKGTVAYGVVGFGGFYALAYWALVSLSSGVAAVLLASGPLLTLVLASLQGTERFTARGAIGSVIAVAGIAVMVGVPSDVRVPIVAVIAVLAAAACNAEAAVVIKLWPTGRPVTTTAFAMLIGSALLIAISVLAREAWSVPSGPVELMTLGYLIVLGSVGLFVVYLVTLKRWTASGMSYIFVLMPIVASALGALLLNEPISAGLVVGGLLILGGVYIGALSGPGLVGLGGRAKGHLGSN